VAFRVRVSRYPKEFWGVNTWLMVPSIVSIESITMNWIGNLDFTLLYCILHCDINLYNVLFDAKLLLKVADLG